MTSQPPVTTPNLPIIWLAPPAALSPPTPKIQPIPLAISATLASLTILLLIVLYNRPHNTTDTIPQHENIELASHDFDKRSEPEEPPTPNPQYYPSASPQTSHTNAHNANMPSTYNPSPSTPHPSPSPATSPPPPPAAQRPQTHALYHTYLKNSLRKPRIAQSPRAPTPASSSRNSYTIPSYYETAHQDHDDIFDDVDVDAVDILDEYRVKSAATSDYSVSIDSTRAPSRSYSTYGEEVNGVWTRLMLGSEYDGDRTFIPSEANLRLGKGREKRR